MPLHLLLSLMPISAEHPYTFFINNAFFIAVLIIIKITTSRKYLKIEKNRLIALCQSIYHVRISKTAT